MVRAGYVPEAGDIVWLDFEPQAGREQTKRRPAVVLSPVAYNGKTSLFVCCPVTTRVKGYPFEVALSGAPQSVALADQVKSLDWRVRNAQPKARATDGEMAEIRAKLQALLGL